MRVRQRKDKGRNGSPSTGTNLSARVRRIRLYELCCGTTNECSSKVSFSPKRTQPSQEARPLEPPPFAGHNGRAANGGDWSRCGNAADKPGDNELQPHT